MSLSGKRVFIAYASDDEAYARAVEQALHRAGISVWSDRHLAPGEEWETAIQNALREAGAVVVITSQNSLASAYVNFEIGAAIAAGTPVFPLLIGDVGSLPAHLRRNQAINVQSADPADIDAMVAAIMDKLNR